MNRRRRRPNYFGWTVFGLIVLFGYYFNQIYLPSQPNPFEATPTVTRSPESFVTQARELVNNGKLSQAIESFEQAIKASPQDPSLYIELARIQVRLIDLGSPPQRRVANHEDAKRAGRLFGLVVRGSHSPSVGHDHAPGAAHLPIGRGIVPNVGIVHIQDRIAKTHHAQRHFRENKKECKARKQYQAVSQRSLLPQERASFPASILVGATRCRGGATFRGFDHVLAHLVSGPYNPSTPSPAIFRFSNGETAITLYNTRNP